MLSRVLQPGSTPSTPFQIRHGGGDHTLVVTGCLPNPVLWGSTGRETSSRSATSFPLESPSGGAFWSPTDLHLNWIGTNRSLADDLSNELRGKFDSDRALLNALEEGSTGKEKFPRVEHSPPLPSSSGCAELQTPVAQCEYWTMHIAICLCRSQHGSPDRSIRRTVPKKSVHEYTVDPEGLDQPDSSYLNVLFPPGILTQ